MTIWKTYYLAQSVVDAISALENSPGVSRPIAGGTDLLLDLQQGRQAPVHTLVDITHIPEMCLIEERKFFDPTTQGETGLLYVGAGLPLNKVVGSPLVQKHAPALIDAASLIGGPQVRNTATLGGNVGHALPAADGTIALLALDAKAEVASNQNRCLTPLEDLFLGPGKSALDPRHELLVGFQMPLRQFGQASAFQRVMRPQGVAIAILNLAVWLDRQGDQIADIRISIGPAGPKPLRARQAEAELKGKTPDQRLMDKALEALLAEAHFRTSPHRATEEYRRQMAAVLLKETFEKAWQRALS